MIKPTVSDSAAASDIEHVFEFNVIILFWGAPLRWAFQVLREKGVGKERKGRDKKEGDRGRMFCPTQYAHEICLHLGFQRWRIKSWS
jgi:hypothetical protein